MSFQFGALLDRLERLQRATPPDDLASAEEPVVQPDQRLPASSEPFASVYNDSAGWLSQHTPSVISWPTQSGIPVCELEDGTHALIIIHLFPPPPLGRLS